MQAVKEVEYKYRTIQVLKIIPKNNLYTFAIIDINGYETPIVNSYRINNLDDEKELFAAIDKHLDYLKRI